MKKSKGHIAFVGDFEYYVQRGEVYKALLQNAFDLDGYRHGRWEAPDRESTYKYKIQPHIDYVKKVGYRVTVGSKYKKRLMEGRSTMKALERIEEVKVLLGEAEKWKGMGTRAMNQVWKDAWEMYPGKAISYRYYSGMEAEKAALQELERKGYFKQKGRELHLTDNGLKRLRDAGNR
jgi:hypothetical protein